MEELLAFWQSYSSEKVLACQLFIADDPTDQCAQVHKHVLLVLWSPNNMQDAIPVTVQNIVPDFAAHFSVFSFKETNCICFLGGQAPEQVCKFWIADLAGLFKTYELALEFYFMGIFSFA